MITSEANAGIKKVVKLQKFSRERKKENCFIVEGVKLMDEAFAAKKLKKAYMTEAFAKQEQERVQVWKNVFSCELVSDSVFSAVSDTITPQGVLGIAEQPVYPLEQLLSDPRRRYLLLDDLRDPGNLGTIMRTAEGADMSAVILSSGSVDLFNPKVVRATMGSIFRMPYHYAEDLGELAEQLKKRQIPVYGCTMEGNIVYNTLMCDSGAGIVIGNEANGISDGMKAHLTDTVRIPMAGKLESLNAAVAAAILMYTLGNFAK